VILDDGFQHHALWRDVDIVLIDASNPFGHGGLVPRGILREPLSGLRRADIIVLSRAEMARDTLPELSRQLRRWHACQPLYGMRTVVKALCHHPSGATLDLTWLQRRHVLAFAGLGNPQAFASTLRDQGAEVVVLLVFPDHHPYSARDWHTIVSWARQYQVAGLVTTEKDAVRLAPSWQAPIPLYTLRIGVAFRPGQEALQQHLQALEGSTATPGSGGGVS
jgi:tetraacyldisaccharide 4'-kinase